MKTLMITFCLIGSVSYLSVAENVKTLEKSKDLKVSKETKESRIKTQLRDKQLRRTVVFNLDDSAGKGPKTCKNGQGSCKADDSEL